MLDLPLVVTLLFVASLGLTLFLGGILARALLRRRWPSVTGKILRSSMETASGIIGDVDITGPEMKSYTVFRPKVVYAYEVAGKAYEGKVVSGFSPPGSEDRATAEAMLARWAPGADVTVYYRPSHPRHAYLIRGDFPRGRLVFLLLSLFPLWWTAKLFYYLGH